MSSSPTYTSWVLMKARCGRESLEGYRDYGGRGIKICERWQLFENFLADMGPRPALGYTIERKDNEGDYEPTNCVWATRREQANNTRRNIRVAHDGRSMTVAQWAREVGISARTLHWRIAKGWEPSVALSLRPARSNRSRPAN